MKKILLIKAAAPLAVLLCYYSAPSFQLFLQTGMSFIRAYDFAGLREYLLSFGAWAPLASIAIMVLQAVVPFFPGVVMTLTNAWLFGWLMGSAYSAVGAGVGAALDFYLGRWYGKFVFEHLAGRRRVERINAFVDRHGAAAIFFLRLLPVIPYKMVSYGAGFSAMHGRVFLAASLLGQMPGILLYSFLGEELLKNASLLLGLTVLFSVGTALFFRCKKTSLQ